VSHIPIREAVRTLQTERGDHRELLVCCEQQTRSRAAELLRRDLDRSQPGVREAFPPTNAAVAG
jgi:DNA-binding GntR family transcriptional regulator